MKHSSEFLAFVEPGDHIAVEMESAPGWHHGIYAGLGPDKTPQVIHLYREDKAAATYRRDPIRSFVGDKQCVAIITYRDTTGSDGGKENSLNRALRCLDDAPSGDIYHFLINNCEHFATFCRTGSYALDILCSSHAVLQECLSNTKYAPNKQANKLSMLLGTNPTRQVSHRAPRSPAGGGQGARNARNDPFGNQQSQLGIATGYQPRPCVGQTILQKADAELQFQRQNYVSLGSTKAIALKGGGVKGGRVS